MADREETHLIAKYHEPIERHVTRPPVGNDQLAQFAFEPPADQRVRRKAVDGGSNRRSRLLRGRRVLITQQLQCALDAIERSQCVNYLRHGLGRAVDSPAASLLIQACTSSAR